MTIATTFIVRIDGTDISFCVPADMPVVKADELAGAPRLKLESSCRNDTCRTCCICRTCPTRICQLLEWQISYRIDWPRLSLDVGLSVGEQNNDLHSLVEAHRDCLL